MTEYSRKVYKKDSKGKIRILHVYTEGADMIQESGLLNGKLVQHRSTSVSKNVGRANETTPQEQAYKEAESKIETKMTTGYFNSIEECENNVVILPMLAKSSKDMMSKVVFPCYGQPKLDGQRGFGSAIDKLNSRKGKEITTLPHISEALKASAIADCADGELYAHSLSFQENMKIIKKNRPGSEKVKFHIYDVILPNSPFIERYQVAKMIASTSDEFVLVETVVLNNQQELDEYHIKNLARGFEGTMIRWGEDGYAINKRANQLLKHKDFIDKVYRVIDIVPSDKRPEQGVVRCELDVKKYYVLDGEGNAKHVSDHAFKNSIYGYPPFKCGMKASHAEREEYLRNKHDYIGQMSETRFFEYTDSGLPRFPVNYGFRNDK